MNKYSAIIIGIVGIAVLGFFALPREKMDGEKTEVVQNEAVKSQMIGNDGAVVEEVAELADENALAQAGSYEAYSSEKIAMAADGDVVLFFHASWCPSCRTLNSDIEKNMSAIPAGVTILKTDYDAETNLKKKYGVTTQHTLVQVDKEGTLIKKWSGGSKLENLLSELQ